MVSCVNDVSDYIHVQREIAHRAVGYSAKNWLRHDVVGALLLGLHRACKCILAAVEWVGGCSRSVETLDSFLHSFASLGVGTAGTFAINYSALPKTETAHGWH